MLDVYDIFDLCRASESVQAARSILYPEVARAQVITLTIPICQRPDPGRVASGTSPAGRSS